MKKYALILLVFLLAACGGVRREGEFGGGGNSTHVIVVETVGEVKLALDQGAIAYDLRELAAWQQGRLPDARSVTVDDIRQSRALPDDKNAPLLFYGEGVLDQRAEDAAEAAISRGYKRVYCFPGGWQQWSK